MVIWQCFKYSVVGGERPWVSKGQKRPGELGRSFIKHIEIKSKNKIMEVKIMSF